MATHAHVDLPAIRNKTKVTLPELHFRFVSSTISNTFEYVKAFAQLHCGGQLDGWGSGDRCGTLSAALWDKGDPPIG